MIWQINVLAGYHTKGFKKNQTLYLQIKAEKWNISYMIVLSIMSTPAVFDTSMVAKLSSRPVPSRPASLG